MKKTVVMVNIQLNFECKEYDARLEKTRTAMQAAGLEVLVVTDPSNMGWLTGYDGWSFYVHQCVLVFLEAVCFRRVVAFS
jgi:ectoine hydrolase